MPHEIDPAATAATMPRAARFRRSAHSGRLARRIVWLTFLLGVMVVGFAVLDAAPDGESVSLRLAIGMTIVVVVTVAVAVGLVVASRRRRALENAWYESTFGGDEDRVLATLDRRYLADLAATATDMPRSADVAFGTVAYRYPYLPDHVIHSLLVRARGWSGEAITAPVERATMPATSSRGWFARIAAGTDYASRRRLRSVARVGSVVVLVSGVLVFFPLSSVAESAVLQCVGVLLVVLAAALFVANHLWSTIWIPRTDYLQVYGNDPERVLDAESADFARRVAEAAGDGSESIFPAAVSVHERFPMLVGFDSVDVVRAAQRRVGRRVVP
jgi:hypothetical protein